MRYLILSLLLIAASQGYSCERINLVMQVTHFNGNSYNENGPLLGCETQSYAYRYMRNSHDKDAFSVTKKYPLVTTHQIHFGAEIGITTGYREQLVNVAGISPWALLTAKTLITKHISATGVFFGAGGGVVINYEY